MVRNYLPPRLAVAAWSSAGQESR